MRRELSFALTLLIGVVIAASAQTQSVRVGVLTQFAPGLRPLAVAATNTGDVVAQVGPDVVSVGPDGQQKTLATISVGPASATPIGLAYDQFHRLYTAVPQAFGPRGAVLKVSASGKLLTAVPGSEGMVAPDGFGLDPATGDMYVTDIFGNGIWRFTPGGSAQLWTSAATNPLLILPDGIKVFDNAVYVSLEAGRILKMPINSDGSAGIATIWAQVPGAFFDDMVLDDRTGNVYVARIDTNEVLQITPGHAITPIATNADGLLGAFNMSLIHVGPSTVIYVANSGVDFFATGAVSWVGPAILEIEIPSRSK
jgi:hypothetical protein